MRKLTVTEFVINANRVHSNYYDYSSAYYHNSKSKIEIVCPIHGNFFQIANQHLLGHGCKKCYYDNKTLTNTQFIAKASIIHNNYFDYSNTQYICNREKVIITCPKHGNFLQLPSNHLMGRGCKKCSLHIPDKEEFAALANSIHKNFYNYYEFVYVNSKTKGIIICPVHGIFYQCPHDHLKGAGCIKCGFERSFLLKCSKTEIDFLTHIGIGNEHRQKFVHGYIVDGYDPNTNTIYEFLGNYWHGNPKMFDWHKLNKQANKTFGELYRTTFIRLNNLKKYAYNVKYVWEDDWDRFKDDVDKEPKILCL